MEMKRFSGDYHKEFTVCIGLPVEWDFGKKPCDGLGGPQPDDALTIDVAISDDEPWESAVYRISLHEIADDMIACIGGAPIQPKHIRSVDRLIVGLRELADKLESAKSPTRQIGDV